MLPRDIPSTSGIYRITCIPTSKIYVGSAVNLYSRWIKHRSLLRQNRHPNAKLQYAWNKYGEEAFVFDILELVLVPEMLTAREQHYFSTLNPFGERGFNFAPIAGSRLGNKQSPEAIEKVRLSLLGRKHPAEFGQKISQRQLGQKFSLQRRQNISAATRGKPSPHRGKKQSPEAIENHRRALTGYKHTEEARRNMGNSHRGSKHSIASREKRRIALLGHSTSEETRAKIAAANRKRKASLETRAKLSAIGSMRPRPPEEYASRRKTLILTSPDGTEYLVHGIHEFCKQHGLDSSSIAKVARGKLAHHHGWTAHFPEADAG